MKPNRKKNLNELNKQNVIWMIFRIHWKIAYIVTILLESYSILATNMGMLILTLEKLNARILKGLLF